MKKYDDGMCSSYEYKEFMTRLYDAVNEWIKYWDSDPEIGITIEQGTLDVGAVLDLADEFCSSDKFDILIVPEN